MLLHLPGINFSIFRASVNVFLKLRSSPLHAAVTAVPVLKQHLLDKNMLNGQMALGSSWSQWGTNACVYLQISLRFLQHCSRWPCEKCMHGGEEEVVCWSSGEKKGCFWLGSWVQEGVGYCGSHSREDSWGVFGLWNLLWAYTCIAIALKWVIHCKNASSKHAFVMFPFYFCSGVLVSVLSICSSSWNVRKLMLWPLFLFIHYH